MAQQLSLARVCSTHLQTISHRSCLIPACATGSFTHLQHGQPLPSQGRRSFYNTSGHTRPVIAIRRETVNVWERRAPLSPNQVRRLVKSGIKVIVQPSDRRAYSMKVSSSLSLSFSHLPVDVKIIFINNTACFSCTVKFSSWL